MSLKNINVKQVTGVSITILVDNYIDNLLPSTEHIKRASLSKGRERRQPLLAEHGFSILIEVKAESETHSIIMDFGVSNIAVPHNIAVLGIDLEKIEGCFISHGHHDHVGSIQEVLKSVGRAVEVVVHPDAFTRDRIHKFPNGKEVAIVSLEREDVEKSGCPIVEVTEPRLLANGYIGTLSEIPRETMFEKGMVTAFYKKDGKLYKDDIKDDQGVVISVKHKGLVVITGCGHSGIINTIRYAKKLTGIDKIYAVIGGFHLIGPLSENVIPLTISEMKRFSPEIIVPCHCTGWKATNEIEKAFPDSFYLNSVGTEIVL